MYVITAMTINLNHSALERTILTEITGIKNDLRELLLRTKPKATSSINLPVQLPLKTKEELDNLELWSADVNNRATLV